MNNYLAFRTISTPFSTSETSSASATGKRCKSAGCSLNLKPSADIYNPYRSRTPIVVVGSRSLRLNHDF